MPNPEEREQMLKQQLLKERERGRAALEEAREAHQAAIERMKKNHRSELEYAKLGMVGLPGFDDDDDREEEEYEPPKRRGFIGGIIDFFGGGSKARGSKGKGPYQKKRKTLWANAFHQ